MATMPAATRTTALMVSASAYPSVTALGGAHGATEDVRRMVGGDGGQHRETDRGTHDPGGVEQARRETCVGRGNARRTGDGDRGHRETHPEPDQDEGPEQIGDEGAVRGDLGEPEETARADQAAEQDQGARAHPGDVASGDLGAGRDQHGLRQEGEPGLQRAEPEYALHEEGLEVPGAEHGPEQEEDHRVSSGHRARAEDAERDERNPRTGLDEEEGAEQHGRDGQGGQGVDVQSRRRSGCGRCRRPGRPDRR